MIETDRQRWDRKYKSGEGPARFRVDKLLEDHRGLLHAGGRALDLACGFGGNSLFLAAAGYTVDAVDVSGFALEQARREASRRGLALHLVQADLTRWWVPRSRYDLIVQFYYVNKDLVPRLAAALKPASLLFMAQRNTRTLALRPEFNPSRLVFDGELRHLAEQAGLQVVLSSDAGYTSTLIARRP